MEQIQIPDLSLWEAFYWVAKRGTFTAAAGQLKISVPFLSKKIGALEENLGTRLFNRTTRRVTMTQEALTLLPRVEALLEEARDIESHARPSEAVAGLIRVSTLPALAARWLPSVLVAFQKQYPEVQFELLVSDQIVDLVESQVDLAIRVQEPVGAQFVFRKLFENELILCAAPSYLKEIKQPLKKIEDLKKHRILMLTVYEKLRFLNTTVTLRDFKAQQTLFCESGSILTELALQGAGVAVRSRWDVSPHLAKGSLVRVLEKNPLEPFGNIYAVTPHRKYLTNRVRLFLDFLGNYLLDSRN